jgi:hypothetical protein
MNIDVRCGVLLSVRAGIAFFSNVMLKSKAHGSIVTDSWKPGSRVVMIVLAALQIAVLKVYVGGGGDVRIVRRRLVGKSKNKRK